jgi:methyl-accepting chemotaxis protein
VAILNLFAKKQWAESEGAFDLEMFQSSTADVECDFRQMSVNPDRYFRHRSVFSKLTFLVDTFNGFIDRMFKAANICASFTFYTKSIVNTVQESNRNIESIQTAMDESVKAADNISENVSRFAQFIEQTNVLSKKIAHTTDVMTDATNRTKMTVDDNVSFIDSLNKEFTKIISITEAVNNIAGMINILSLNASIEAARAGEHGRSFAAVAEEIKKLSVQTQMEAKKIDNEIKTIVGNFNGLNERNQAIKSSIDESMVFIENIVQSFSDLDNKIGQTDTMINTIAANIEEQSVTIRTISDTVEIFSESLRAMNTDVNRINQESGVLINSINQSLNAVVKKVITGNTLEAVIDVLFQAQKEWLETIESAVKKGELSKEDLFDVNYTPVSETNPVRYKTRYTDFFKSRIQPLEDAYLKKMRNLKYFVMIDANGYIPAHNSMYEKPSTGIYEKDIGNRSMRIFADPFNLSIAQNKNGLLIQTYARDTGEVMTDVSTSVFIDGRHWGCIRVGLG